MCYEESDMSSLFERLRTWNTDAFKEFDETIVERECGFSDSEE